MSDPDDIEPTVLSDAADRAAADPGDKEHLRAVAALRRPAAARLPDVGSGPMRSGRLPVVVPAIDAYAQLVEAAAQRRELTAAQHAYPWTRLYSQDYSRVVWDSDTDDGTMVEHLLASGCDWLGVLTIHENGQREAGRLSNEGDGWVRLRPAWDHLKYVTMPSSPTL